MAFPAGWQRRCPLVIQESKIPADQTAFPVLITEVNLPDEMKTTGGTNAAQADGGDIRFSTNSDGSGQLACEIVIWTQNATPANAKAEIWVPVNISGSVDTTIYVWYKGGGSETQPAASAPFGSQAVWDSNYKLVFHLSNGSVLNVNDSTSNANNGTDVNSQVPGTGQIDGGIVSIANTTIYVSTAYVPPTTNFTYSGWVKSTNRDASNRPFGSADAVNGLTGASIIYGFKPGDIIGSDSIYCVIRQGSNVTTGDITYNPAGLGSGFTYLALRMDSTTGASLVKDGVQVATNSAYTSITLGGLTFTVTKDPNQTGGNGFGFGGSVDEVRVSDVVRSTNWLLTEYNNQGDPSTFIVEGSPEGPGFTVQVADQLFLSDSVSIIGADPDYQLQFADSITLIDPFTAVPLVEKSFSDTLSLSDAVTVLPLVEKEFSDTIALSDNLGLTFSFPVTLSDNLLFLDTLLTDINPGTDLEFQDSLNLTDTLFVTWTAGTVVSDALTLADRVETRFGYDFLGDDFAFTDAVAVSLDSIFVEVTKQAADTLALSDSIQTTYQGAGEFGDSFNFQDRVKVILNSRNLNYLRRYLNDV